MYYRFLAIEGEFEKDDIVRIIDFEGNPVGVGKANCDSAQAREAMGKRPFTGCEKLTTVDFQGSPYFTCDNSIIYSLENGKKKDIIVVVVAGTATPVRFVHPLKA